MNTTWGDRITIIRGICAVSVGAAMLLTGCGGSDTVSAPSTPTPTVSDEDQIRDVVKQVAEAHGGSDTGDVAELTCEKYRAGAEGEVMSPEDIPPMSALPLDMFSSLSPEKLAEALGQEYVGASPESLQALANALLARDEPAYKKAMADVMTQSMKVNINKVDNIKVDGDTATADVVLDISAGGKMSYTTDPSQITLVKEDGKWKDCTPPESE